VNGYHRRRIQELKNQAMILGGRAKMFKSNVEMNPMNAYERMIIHTMFAEDPEIVTQSEGVGKTRRVVLKYQEKRENSISSDLAV
jgi:spoIIIJ-associated protein